MVLAAVAAILVAVGLALRHYTRPDTLTALLQAQVRQQLGAELTVGSGARYGFWPRLHVLLPEPSLRAAGSATPIATAGSLEVSLPLASLWSDATVIDHLVLAAPRVDVDALEAWLAARPPAPDSTLPDIRFALEIRDGRLIRRGAVLADGVELTVASTGDVAAWLARVRADPAAAQLPPMTGRLRAQRIHAGGVDLEGVELEVRDGGD